MKDAIQYLESKGVVTKTGTNTYVFYSSGAITAHDLDFKNNRVEFANSGVVQLMNCKYIDSNITFNNAGMVLLDKTFEDYIKERQKQLYDCTCPDCDGKGCAYCNQTGEVTKHRHDHYYTMCEVRESMEHEMKSYVNGQWGIIVLIVIISLIISFS